MLDIFRYDIVSIANNILEMVSIATVLRYSHHSQIAPHCTND